MLKLDTRKILSSDLKEIMSVFKINGFDIKIAGGAVRDIVLGKDPKDIDLATTATPEQMVKVLHGFRTIPTGLHHGTITVLGKSSSEEFEITTLRIDSNHNGRHADVEWTDDFMLDASRRDLTYNSMFMDFDGTVHDFFGGVEDLKNGVTKAVGDPVQRFREDYLRILRMFRFTARFGHVLSDETIDAISVTRSGLETVSGERVWQEMQKILSGPDPRYVLKMMEQTGTNDVIEFPKVSEEIYNDLPRICNLGDPILTLGAILDYTEATKVCDRWKLSTEESNKLLFVVNNKDTDESERETKTRIVVSKNPAWTKSRFVEVFAIKGKDNNLKNWEIPVFPVTGNDLLNTGMKPGPELGAKLVAIKNVWIKSNYLLDKKELLGI